MQRAHCGLLEHRLDSLRQQWLPAILAKATSKLIIWWIASLAIQCEARRKTLGCQSSAADTNLCQLYDQFYFFSIGSLPITFIGDSLPTKVLGSW
jgi:hypothetical protein